MFFNSLKFTQKNCPFLTIYRGVPRALRGVGLPALSRAATILAIKSLRGTRPFSLAPKNKKKRENPASPNG